jgi:isopentenyl phosphate kinase
MSRYEHQTNTASAVYTEEAMYALIYQVCHMFTEECGTKRLFMETLKIFIEEDLKEEETKKYFNFVRNHFKEVSYGQIQEECKNIPRILAKADKSSWQALVELEIDQITKGY